jgi:ubiquitin-protein ligase
MALRTISKQVAALRDEEQAEDSWFSLPFAGDEDVDWMRFEVEMEGPATYAAPPGSAGAAAPAAAPRASPYAAGSFRVRVTIPVEYPRAPPGIEFLTKLWHPNIDWDSGKPCIDLLKEAWKPTMTLRDLLLLLRGLLADPNPTDSVNAEAARELLEDRDVFDKHALDMVKKHAAVDE